MDFSQQSSANTSVAGLLSGNSGTTPAVMVSSLGGSSVPTANTVIMYDASSSVNTNNYINRSVDVTAAGTITPLTAASARVQNIIGSTANQTIALPSALTLQLGHTFTITNASTSTGIVSVTDFNNVLILTVLSSPNGNGTRLFTLCNNSTAGGIWVPNDRSVRGRIALDTDVTVGTLKFRLNLSLGNGLQVSSTAAAGNVSCHSTAVRYQGATPTLAVTQQVNLAVTPSTPVNITGSVAFTNNSNTAAVEVFEYTSGIYYRVSLFIGPTFNCIDVNAK